MYEYSELIDPPPVPGSLRVPIRPIDPNPSNPDPYLRTLYYKTSLALAQIPMLLLAPGSEVIPALRPMYDHLPQVSAK